MATKKNSPALQRWIDALPLNEHPLVRLLKVLEDPTLPASLRIEGLLGAARFFSPIYSSSKNEVAGEVQHRPVVASRFEVISALASLPIEERRAVLEGKLQLSLEPPAGEADATE